jgi:hypothetical protein
MTTVGNEVYPDSTEEFAGRIVGVIDSASLAILLSIGHQTKLFDTMVELPPASTNDMCVSGSAGSSLRGWSNTTRLHGHTRYRRIALRC